MVKSESPDVKQDMPTSEPSDKTGEIELKSRELLSYFKALSAVERQGILKNLQDDKEENVFVKGSLELSNSLESKTETEKVALYDSLMEERRKKLRSL
jgi:hypothetical protein